jgi:hypothetical protein
MSNWWVGNLTSAVGDLVTVDPWVDAGALETNRPPITVRLRNFPVVMRTGRIRPRDPEPEGRR